MADVPAPAVANVNIPKPGWVDMSEAEWRRALQKLQEAGVSAETIRAAAGTRGLPEWLLKTAALPTANAADIAKKYHDVAAGSGGQANAEAASGRVLAGRETRAAKAETRAAKAATAPLFDDVRNKERSAAENEAKAAEEELARQQRIEAFLTGQDPEGLLADPNVGPGILASPGFYEATQLLHHWAGIAGVSVPDLMAGKSTGTFTFALPDGSYYGPVEASSIDEFVSLVADATDDRETQWVLSQVTSFANENHGVDPKKVQQNIEASRVALEQARADVEALGSTDPAVFAPAIERRNPGVIDSVALPTKHTDADKVQISKVRAAAKVGDAQMGGRRSDGGGQTAARQAPSQQAQRKNRIAELEAKIARMKQHPSRSKLFRDQLKAAQDELAGLKNGPGGPNEAQYAESPPAADTDTGTGADTGADVDTGVDVGTGADVGTGDYTDGGGGAPWVDPKQANQDAVQQILAEQFGGFAFFLQHNNTDLNVGLTADGTIVDWQDPSAVSTKNILDVIVDKGIVAPTRVIGVLQKTKWWQTTDAQMRSFDARWGEMSQPQKEEYLAPTIKALKDEASFLGFVLDDQKAFDEARKLARLGETDNTEMIRGWMIAQGQNTTMGNDMSSFAAARDQVKAMASKYFTPVNDADATALAEKVYVGADGWDQTKLEQYFKTQATGRFPSLDHAINELGITPEEYFAPYRYQIEKMLDRPNVDILNEFPDIINYVPDGAGTDNAPRPMTLGEMRTYIRGRDEWQNSTQGKDSAQALAFALGRTFGEVA